MTREELREAVIPRMARIFRVEEDALSDDALLVDDLHAKSASMFALASLLEKTSGKPADFTALSACKTVGEAFDLVAED